MSYEIKPYTRKRAKEMGVKVKPSTVKGKKIDVYKKGEKGASVGAIGYGDFPTFVRTRGEDFALERRKANKKRHERYRHKVDTPSYYADKLLW